MIRSEFLRGGLAVPFAVVGGAPVGDRNIRDMTLAEVFERMGGTVSIVGEGLDRMSTRTLILAWVEHAEVRTNDEPCCHCQRATFHYRWLKPYGEWPGPHPYPTPWYCVCGHTVERHA